MDTASKNRHTSYKLPACPVEATLELIGGKWKGIVLYYLLDGRLRFSELKQKIGCVTQRMLTKQLRELEASALVNRIVYAEVPPKVEYELTKEGRSLEPILNVLKEWGETHGLKLLENRASQILHSSRSSEAICNSSARSLLKATEPSHAPRKHKNDQRESVD